MSTSTQSADLVRLTVSAGDRTMDLVLPSRLPLAEILPEVASLVGSLDAYEAYGGYALVGADGHALDLDASFLAQGVHDGTVLTLVTGAEAEEKKVYDDVVEAVADAVEGLGAGWTAQNSRATTLGISALLLALGATALFLQRQGGSSSPSSPASRPSCCCSPARCSPGCGSTSRRRPSCSSRPRCMPSSPRSAPSPATCARLPSSSPGARSSSSG